MRLAKACRLVYELGLNGLLIDNPTDVFYLTGQWFSVARLLLKPQGAVLLVDGRYFAKAKECVAVEVILIEKDTLYSQLKDMQKIGFDSAQLTVDQASALQQLLDIQWVPVSRPLKTLRVVKDAGELASLKKAAQVTRAGYENLLKHLKEGVLEENMGLEFEMFCRHHGASRLSFDPIVAFGKNSAFPHYHSSHVSLKKNQNVLLDLGAVVDHYRGDMTRVFFFGERQKELEKFYQLVKQAHDKAAALVRPGVRVGDLDVCVREFFATQGVETLFSHSLGHGIGLDVHEYPILRADGTDRDLILETGMVFTIEPGLYLPGVGGVRYENTVAVTDDGCENFYADI